MEGHQEASPSLQEVSSSCCCLANTCSGRSHPGLCTLAGYGAPPQQGGYGQPPQGQYGGQPQQGQYGQPQGACTSVTRHYLHRPTVCGVRGPSGRVQHSRAAASLPWSQAALHCESHQLTFLTHGRPAAAVGPASTAAPRRSVWPAPGPAGPVWPATSRCTPLCYLTEDRSLPYCL